MKQKLINNVLQGMLPFLNNAQSAQLQKVLERELCVDDILEFILEDGGGKENG